MTAEKVKFPIEPGEWHGYTAEYLACNRSGPGQYTVDAVPFFVMGISKGDIVSCDVLEGVTTYRKTVIRSGNWTYRIIIDKAVGIEAIEAFVAEIYSMVDMSADPESDPVMFALCVAPDNVHAVYEIIEKYYREHMLDFEEANVGSQPTSQH